MKVILGTTNKRKIMDLRSAINQLDLDIEILSIDDIGWDRGEIEENGISLEENSLIKAYAILDFCIENNIFYPIITDDSGLFCDALDDEPGIYTARYADDELSVNPELPKYQCVIKLLEKMENLENRNASFRCCVTYMMNDGTYFQEFGESRGYISKDIIGKLEKPYFYSVFILDDYNIVFSDLNEYQLNDTYRTSAFKKTLIRVKK